MQRILHRRRRDARAPEPRGSTSDRFPPRIFTHRPRATLASRIDRDISPAKRIAAKCRGESGRLDNASCSKKCNRNHRRLVPKDRSTRCHYPLVNLVAVNIRQRPRFKLASISKKPMRSQLPLEEAAIERLLFHAEAREKKKLA